jgi:hypothetical protein
MITVRAVISAAAFCVMSSPFVPDALNSCSPRASHASAIFQFNSGIARPMSVGLPQSSTLTRFTPWKARPKIVLGESDQRLYDETDLGPALMPVGLSSSVPTTTTTLRRPSLPPLRC